MTAVIETVNNLIYKAKDTGMVDDVRFLKAFNGNLAENPVEGYIAVVRIEKIAKSQNFIGGYFDSNTKGELYNAKVAVNVYSGESIPGEDLSAVALNIHSTILSVDDSNIIENSYILPIEFDGDIKAIYREICFELAFCLCGEKE